jgi:ABC-type bacteriocin/lantibiotic exporter with double-glycine peptidase domain
MFNTAYYFAARIQSNISTTLSAALSSKVRYLRMSMIGENTTSLITLDVDRVADLVDSMYSLCIDSLLCISISALLVFELGLSIFVVVVFLALLLLCQFYIGKKQGSAREATTSLSATRVDMISRIFSAIFNIKLLAWEVPMLKRIQAVRENEVRHARSAMFLEFCRQSLLSFWPSLTGVFSVIMYRILYGKIETAKVYVVLVYLGMFGTPLSGLSKALTALIITKDSIRRIEDLINLPELSSMEQIQPRRRTRASTLFEIEDSLDSNVSLASKVEVSGMRLLSCHSIRHAFSLTNKEFRWSQDLKTRPVFSLTDFHLYRSESVAIVGDIGTGKSTLLKILLNEVNSSFLNPKKPSRFQSQGKISYFGNPWIMKGSLKENVLAGNQFHQEFYERVLDATGLMDDNERLPSRLTSRGDSLSGGQKARIGIARALYARCNPDFEVFLFDDPFVALDKVLAKNIFAKGIMTLLDNTARVVVIKSNLEFLRAFDRILVLEKNQKDGPICSVAFDGNYETLRQTFPQYDFGDRIEVSSLLKSDEQEEKEFRIASTRHRSFRRMHGVGTIPGFKSIPNVQKEAMDKNLLGSVETPISNLKAYLKAMFQSSEERGFVLLYCLPMVLFFVLSEALKISADTFLAKWASSEAALYLLAFLGSVLAVVLILVLRAHYLASRCANASTYLHHFLFDRLVRCSSSTLRGIILFDHFSVR